MRFFFAISGSALIITLALIFGDSPLVASVATQSGVLASLPNVSEARAETNVVGPIRVAAEEFPVIESKSAVVVDAETGVILGEKDKDLVSPIASITKLMTALVFLDYNAGWDRSLVISRQDTRSGAALVVWPGERLTYHDMFMTMLVASANNAAIALTRAAGLSVPEFVDRMNEKADIFGLSNTEFADPTGLESGNVSSALDLVRLGKYAFDNMSVREALIVSEYVFTPLNGRASRRVRTTDDLLTAQTEGYRILGAKTGFTTDAGYTFLIQAINADGERVLVALLDAPTEAARFQDADRLIQWAFESYDWK